MKKIGGLLTGLLLVTGIIMWPAESAHAAACANVSSFGSVNLTVPNLPNDDSRALWVRIQTVGTEGTLLAEINKEDCLEIKSQEATPDQWSWVAYQSDGRTALVDFPARQGNTIRFYGVTDGLKLDRVLLTEESCIPADFGNNCKDALELGQATTGDDVEILTPPSDSPVSGRIMPSPTPLTKQGALSKLEYVVDGKVLQSSADVRPFDTTLIKNGRHTITINTTLNDGSVIRESTVIEVRNAENVLTPLVRWVRLNGSTVRILLGAVGGLLLLGFCILALRNWHRRSRERQFHGF